MKFLSDLGSCYRPSSAQVQRQQPEGPDNSVQVVLVSGYNETWSKQRRKKMNVSKYWRPELSVISEDRVVSFLEIDQESVHHHQKVSSKSKTSSTAKPPPSSCHYKDDCYEYYARKNSTSMLIPAFSPTPFMF